MVNPFRRWFAGARDVEAQSWAAVAAWAKANGHRFARSSDHSGFVIEAASPGASWRLEWGAPQRHYFSQPELRVRGEVGATGELQMLVIARELMSLLEQQVYEESTDGTETRMDDSLPEEMRWLVLYPKLPRSELGVLRERFAALSNLPRAVHSWLDAPLVEQLDASSSWLPEPLPLLLVVQRGRLTLRCALPEPGLAALQGALGLFATALTAARRVGDEMAKGSLAGGRPSTWGAASAGPPVDEPPR